MKIRRKQTKKKNIYNTARKAKNCLLCNRPHPQHEALFFPEIKQVHRYGGIPGKRRVFIYRFCNECEKLPRKLLLHIAEERIRFTIDEAISKVELANATPKKCRLCGGIADMVHVSPRVTECMVFATCENCREGKI